MPSTARSAKSDSAEPTNPVSNKVSENASISATKNWSRRLRVSDTGTEQVTRQRESERETADSRPSSVLLKPSSALSQGDSNPTAIRSTSGLPSATLRVNSSAFLCVSRCGSHACFVPGWTPK